MLRRVLLATVFLLASAAHAETIAVIGTGNVGMALGSEFGGLGHTVIYGSRTPDSAKTKALIFGGNPPKVTYGTDRSLGEIVQEAHPDTFVVKAFNTIGRPLMIDPPVPAPVISLAGEDAAANKQVAQWVRTMGIDTVDVGGIYHARATEFMVVMMLNNNFSRTEKFDVVFNRRD